MLNARVVSILCPKLYVAVRCCALTTLTVNSGGATLGRARSHDLAGRSTALAQALAPPCLALRITLLR